MYFVNEQDLSLLHTSEKKRGGTLTHQFTVKTYNQYVDDQKKSGY